MKPLNNIELILQAVYRKEKNWKEGNEEIMTVMRKQIGIAWWLVGILSIISATSIAFLIMIYF